MTADQQAPGNGVPVPRSGPAPAASGFVHAAIPAHKSTPSSVALPHACDEQPMPKPVRTPARALEGAGRQDPGRLVAIDAARGCALLLIMLAHLLPFSRDDGSPTLIYVIGDYGAVAFVFIAGIGVALSTGGPKRVSGRALTRRVVVLVVRALAIASIGLALGYVVDYDDDAVVVLASYGLMFLFAVPLVRLTARGAALAAAVIAIVVPVLVQLVWSALPAAREVNPTFGRVAAHPWGWLVEETVKGVYPALPWMAYFCAGIAVGRLRSLTSRLTAVCLVATGIALAVGANLLSRLLLVQFGGQQSIARTVAGKAQLTDRLQWGPRFNEPRSTPWWLATNAPYSATPLELLQSLGVALALLGLFVLLSLALGRRLHPLAAIGSMTLTLYTLHLLFLARSDLPWGSWWTALVHVGAAFAVAALWLAHWRRGPLEAAIDALATRAQRLLGVAPDRPPGPGHSRTRQAERGSPR